jgi:hypothetical protein
LAERQEKDFISINAWTRISTKKTNFNAEFAENAKGKNNNYDSGI